VRLRDLNARHDLNARKGSVWALSFADGKLVDADYLPDLAPAVPPEGHPA
jgi:hypothetical protein